MDQLAPTRRSKIKRLHQRARYDRAAIDGVLDAGLVCQVGYSIDGLPYVTTTSYWRDGDWVYWHGSSASRMLRQLRQGVPACFTVSLIDGLVLARSGFNHSINYRSVTLYGEASLVEGTAAKLSALEAFTERLLPGRWAELRPPTTQELKATTVLRMPIREGGAKIRTGPPKDDAADCALPIWAGIVPLQQVALPPVADPQLPPGIPLPKYLERYAGPTPPGDDIQPA
jgi:hypothetical protein